MSEADLRVLRLALNRITDGGPGNPQALRLEFSDLLELEPKIDLEVSGFEIGEIDVLLDGYGLDQEDDLPTIETATTPVTRRGDLWLLNDHRLYCGDSLYSQSYARVLGTDKAVMTFADPPITYQWRVTRQDWGRSNTLTLPMASGELSSAEFQSFLWTSLGPAAGWSINGAIHFVCMDWRHQQEIIAAGDQVYSELKNLCVWNKSNAGMGSLYRSKHELIFVYKYECPLQRSEARRDPQHACSETSATGTSRRALENQEMPVSSGPGRGAAGPGRRRGARPLKFEHAKEAIGRDLQQGRHTVAQLENMREKNLPRTTASCATPLEKPARPSCRN